MKAMPKRRFTREIAPSEVNRTRHEERLKKFKSLNAPAVILVNEEKTIKKWREGFKAKNNTIHSDGFTLTIRTNTKSDVSTVTYVLARQWSEMDAVSSADMTRIIVFTLSLGQLAHMDFPSKYRQEDAAKAALEVDTAEKAFVQSQLPTDFATNPEVRAALQLFFNWDS